MRMLDQCELCHGLRGHGRLKELMCVPFEIEYNRAQREVDRLQSLFKDVCWYNFEVNAQRWNAPWPMSWPYSPLVLHGFKLETMVRNGREVEAWSFPEYYAGRLADAPLLPPQIVLSELKAAMRYRDDCLKQTTAPHDWAPGGVEYLKLLETTRVPTDAKRKRKEAVDALLRISKRLAQDEPTTPRD